MNCYHHPNHEATHIVNLGTKFDLYTAVCVKCAEKVEWGIKTGLTPNATIQELHLIPQDTDDASN